VNKTWGAAAFHAQNESVYTYRGRWPKLLKHTQNADLSDCSTFDLYQAGKISKEKHLLVLQDYLFGSNDDNFTIEECLECAELIHTHILGRQYPGAFLTLLALLKNSITTGCLSNTSQLHWDILKDNEEYSAIALMQHNALSFEIGFNKPDIKAFKAFEEMSFARSPRNILYFDDVQANVDAARNAGWEAELVVSDEDNTIRDIRGHLINRGIIQV
jgi:FMN phosphatase YigB (HAD superfamily)